MRNILTNTTLLGISILFFKIFCSISGSGAQGTDCGTLKVNARDVRTRVPWLTTVFIQKTRTASFRFLLTGIIVGPSAVLTVFPGPYGQRSRNSTSQSQYTLYPPESIFVIGGPVSTLPETDSHSVFRQVKYILPYRGHGRDNQEYHYVILHLETPFDLSTPYIRPICLPPLRVPKTLRDSAASFYDTKVGGFFSPRNSNGSFQLAVNSIKVNTNKMECEEAYRTAYNRSNSASHALCAVLTTPKSPACSMYGNAVFVEFGDRSFLAGMVVLIPGVGGTGGKCAQGRLHFFTDLYDHLPWIINNVKCSSDSFPCSDGTCVPLSKVCDGTRNCKDGLDEDPTLCQSALRNCPPRHVHRCDLSGKCLIPEELCNGVSDCSNGSDESRQVCSNSTRRA